MTPRQWIGVGAVVTVAGIAVAGTAPIVGTDGSSRTHLQQMVGGLLVVLGWALLAWAIHAFGRARE